MMNGATSYKQQALSWRFVHQWIRVSGEVTDVQETQVTVRVPGGPSGGSFVVRGRYAGSSSSALFAYDKGDDIALVGEIVRIASWGFEITYTELYAQAAPPNTTPDNN